MSWIIYGIILYIASVSLYLIIRGAQIRKISIQSYSFWLFGVPAVMSLVAALATHVSLSVNLHEIVELIITGIFFCWLANMLSQKGILNSPNTGYALIIQKSYVLFTTVVAVLIFGAQISLPKVLSILAILFFSWFIVSPETKGVSTEKSGSSWIWYSIAAFFCFGFYSLASKNLLSQGLSPFTVLFYICIVAATLIFVTSKSKKALLSPKISELPFLLGIGLSNGIFSLATQFGLKTAPNIGYINAINAASIAAVAFLAHFIYKDHLSRKKIIGLIGVTLGLIALLLIK
jgi:drug/metabolite transporter (DMT)-like permease